MRRFQLSLDQYDTDKIPSNYLEMYDPILEQWVNKKINLLELGVYRGGSLILWHDYFPLGKIVGIDINLPKDIQFPERIHVFQGNQEDTQFLSRISREIAPDGFDIIIDDASHIGELSKVSFWHLFENHLKPHGLYVIEDWGTGYWSNWPDGRNLKVGSYNKTNYLKRIFNFYLRRYFHIKVPMRCHSYGMVGLIKQLIDEQGASDVTRYNTYPRSSKFEKMIITHSLVFIIKAAK
jgi:hypothetical protein